MAPGETYKPAEHTHQGYDQYHHDDYWMNKEYTKQQTLDYANMLRQKGQEIGGENGDQMVLAADKIQAEAEDMQPGDMYKPADHMHQGYNQYHHDDYWMNKEYTKQQTPDYANTLPQTDAETPRVAE